MEKKNVTATEVCSAINVKQNTFSDWVNAKTYPRIDAIEKMAQYFGISKAFLVEDIKPIDIFTDEERNLMLEYRKADHLTQEMVKRALKYKEV
jgi:transcriptional regulator with XRE-family HTH domain